jgi:hypothetical protein
MKNLIHGVSVCIDYDDFLSLSIESHLRFFDHYTVVTTAEDKATLALCGKFGVEPVISTRKNLNDLDFNLPALINDGLRHLSSTHWTCKIDSDIFLPDGFILEAQGATLDPNLIYGARRAFCETKTLFEKYKKTGDFEILEPPYEDTDTAYGFFQLFHPSAEAFRLTGPFYDEVNYHPPSYTNDRELCSRFEGKVGTFSSPVVHLGLEAIGTNWFGRKAPPFL